MPNNLDSAPSKERIRELYEHIQNDEGWTQQRTLDTWLKTHYFDEHAIFLEDTADENRKRQIEPERFSVGEPARIVDLIQSFYPSPPRMGTHYVGSKAKDPSSGEDVAIALNEAIDQLNPPADSPWRISVFNKVLYGRSADLICKGSDYWSDFPFKGDGELERDWAKREAAWRKKAPIPVAWISLDPTTTFPASLSTINDEGLSWKTLSWTDIQDMFDEEELSEVKIPDDTNLFKPQTLITYSNRHSIAYMIAADTKTDGLFGSSIHGRYDDKIVRSVEHGLGRSAIRILPGITSGRKEPPYYWRSILYPVMALLESIDTLGSRAATSAKFNAYPWMKMHIDMNAIDPDDDGERAVLDKHTEQDVTFLNAGGQGGEGREDIQPVFQPKAGDEIRELFIFALDRAAQITGASGVLEGQLTANTPAWSTNASAEQAKRKLSPLTTNIIASAIDITESISLAAQAFDEEIELANPGGGEGAIKLIPKQLEGWQPVLTGTYSASVPQNFRADWDMGLAIMERTKELGYGPSPALVMDKFMGIHEPWKQVEELLEFQVVLSEKMREAQNKIFVNRFEAQIAEDEGMSEEELLASGLPPEIIAAMMQQGEQPTESNGRVSPQTAGAVRADSPFSTALTGPNPTEEFRQ